MTDGDYLIGVESPILQFFFEERTAYVERIMQLAGPIVVENLGKDSRVAVEKILVEDRVVVSERLGEPRQPSGRDLLQGGLVRLVADATHVDCDAVINVRHYFAGGLFRDDVGDRICSLWLRWILLRPKTERDHFPVLSGARRPEMCLFSFYTYIASGYCNCEADRGRERPESVSWPSRQRPSSRMIIPFVCCVRLQPVEQSASVGRWSAPLPRERISPVSVARRRGRDDGPLPGGCRCLCGASAQRSTTSSGTQNTRGKCSRKFYYYSVADLGQGTNANATTIQIDANYYLIIFATTTNNEKTFIRRNPVASTQQHNLTTSKKEKLNLVQLKLKFSHTLRRWTQSESVSAGSSIHNIVIMMYSVVWSVNYSK